MSGAQIMAALGTPGLTPLEQLVYAVLVGWSSDGRCIASIREIANHLNRGSQRPTILRTIQALAGKELIRIERVENRPAIYILSDIAVLLSQQHPVALGATPPVALTTTPPVALGATPNGGNQPISVALRATSLARVDSSSSLTESKESVPSTADKVPTSESSRARARKKPQFPIPEDWFPDDKGVKFAQEHGVAQTELARFINYHQAKGTLSADWAASWRTWCINAQKFRQQERAAKQRVEQDRPHIGFGF